MKKKIIEYQKAFNSIISDLQNNINVLGVTVFGSIITGDIWEDSDIDLFVIVNGENSGLKDVYGEEHEVSMHLKILSKQEFLDFTKNHLGGSTIHRKLISSKLMVSKDMEITDRFNAIKYYNDIDKERWNLVYLGKLLKDINACKKYIHNGKTYSQFTTIVSAIDNFSKLYLNYNGYLVSKNSTSTLVNLNDECEILVNNLMKDMSKDNINEVILYVEKFLNENIKKCCSSLLDYLCENQQWSSSQEMKKDWFFQDFNIEMEEILGELYKRNIIDRSLRDYKCSIGQTLIKEKVYRIKI